LLVKPQKSGLASDKARDSIDGEGGIFLYMGPKRYGCQFVLYATVGIGHINELGRLEGGLFY
jgi:hypothetical protein